MSNLDITQIVDRLAGRAEWVGETYADEQAFENLSTIDYLQDHLLRQLVANVEAMNSHPENYSAKKLGTASKALLLEIKNQIIRLGL